MTTNDKMSRMIARVNWSRDWRAPVMTDAEILAAMIEVGGEQYHARYGWRTEYRRARYRTYWKIVGLVDSDGEHMFVTLQHNTPRPTMRAIRQSYLAFLKEVERERAGMGNEEEDGE